MTLVTFWILLAVKCPLENYSKPYGCATAMPPAWGLTDTGLCAALRAMQILALEFISKYEKRSRKRRGAKCPRGDTQSCGELFFPVLYRLIEKSHEIVVTRILVGIKSESNRSKLRIRRGKS